MEAPRMYCIKCGKETEEGQVFCEDCLADMAIHPVKPGTPVLLPIRPTAAKKSPSRRKGPTAAEQAVKLRRVVQWLALGMVVLIAVLFVTVSALVFTLRNQDVRNVIGQNYNTMTQPEGN